MGRSARQNLTIGSLTDDLNPIPVATIPQIVYLPQHLVRHGQAVDPRNDLQPVGPAAMMGEQEERHHPTSKSMKTATTFVLLTVSLCICTSVSAQTKTPAFPSAQGFGAFAKGGRGGKVFIVTTTEDYGVNEPVIKGSFREAVEATIPRTVVFEVSGGHGLAKRHSWSRLPNPLKRLARIAQEGEDGRGPFPVAFYFLANHNHARRFSTTPRSK